MVNQAIRQHEGLSRRHLYWVQTRDGEEMFTSGITKQEVLIKAADILQVPQRTLTATRL